MALPAAPLPGRGPVRLRARRAEPAWRTLLLSAERQPSLAGLLARAALLVGLTLWTLSFLRHGLDAERLMGSFLHLVNLPFHEAGHVLLAPFGRFLTVLGGSLCQVLVPLACAAVFLWKTRDPYAAAVASWWAGQSLMDLAPYVADARALQLPLLGGRTGAEVFGHDWEYLLQALGLLNHDVALGRLAFGLGALTMAAAIGWASAVLWQQRGRVSRVT